MPISPDATTSRTQLQRFEIAVVVTDGEQGPGRARRSNHPLAGLGRRGHRLFDQHMLAGFRRGDRQRFVERRRRGDDDRVDLGAAIKSSASP